MFFLFFVLYHHSLSDNSYDIYTGFSYQPPPEGLLGGGIKEEQRAVIYRFHQMFPTWSAKRIRHRIRSGPNGDKAFVMSVATIRRHWNNPNFKSKPRPGNNTKLTKWHHIKIAELARGKAADSPTRLRKGRLSIPQIVNYLRTSAPIQRRISINDITVNRSLANSKLKYRIRRSAPQITDANRDSREQYYNWMFSLTAIQRQTICWSDSVPLSGNHSTNKRNEGVWVKDSDPVPVVVRLRRPASTLHCYGVLTRHKLLGPYFITGSINQTTYQRKILQPIIRDLIFLFKAEPFIFQQDGAGAHRANKTQQYLKSKDLDFIEATEWPGNSPDLNHIESVWSDLKQKILPVGHYGIKHPELQRRAIQYFHNFNRNKDYRKYISNIDERLHYLKKVNYWSIPY